MKQARIVLVLLITALLASACNLGSGSEITATLAPSATGSRTATGTITVTPTVRIPTQLPLPTTRGTIVSQLPTARFPTTAPIGTVIPPAQEAPQQPIRIAILSPGPGSVVSGNVQVTGAAVHPRFLQYQLEYGPDPNPAGLWYPVDSVRFTPVVDNVLGAWNTSAVPDGTYTLRLRVFLRDGTTLSTVSNNIRVRNTAPTPVPSATPSVPRPVAAFSADRYSGESPVTVRFFNQSSGNISGVTWNFGDNTTSSEPNPTHTYSSPGLYTVTLSVTGPGGTSNVSSQINVRTTTAPIAGFTQSVASGRAPLTVQFTDQSTGNITSWLWNFSDGTLSNERNPSHTFNGVGTYNVFLTVTGPGGTSIARRQILVENPVVPPPTALFVFNPPTGVAPLTVQFTNQSQGNITGYTWNFGDGTLSNETNPVHTFTAAGTYPVTLFATGPGGHNTTLANVIVVAPTATFTTTPIPPTETFTETPVPPTATFTETPVPPTATFTETLTETPLPLPVFTDTPTTTVVPPTATFTETPTETPVPPTATFTETPTNTPVPPTALFTAAAVPGSPLSIQFTNQSSGEITGMTWDFGDGATSNEPNPVHIYTQGGDYTVTLTVSGPGGSNSYQNVVSVLVPPTASFSASVTADPMSIQFANQSTGSVGSLTWDFGDGTTSAEPNPVHTYAAAGDYNVTLTVTAIDGVTTDSETQTITVVAPTATAVPVDAVFTSAPVEGSPLTVQFANQSTGPVGSLTWDFGDSMTSNEPNPVHTYAAGGDYTVTLTVVSNADGSTDTATSVVSVVAPTPTTVPVDANFSAAPVEGSPLTIQFTNASSGPVATYLWDFGDGTSSSEVHPVHTYAAGGDYNVTLTATAADGVTTDSVTNPVSVVAPTPTPTVEPVTAAFSAAPVEGAPLTVQFTNQSTGPVVAVTWDFGDGTTSNEPNPVHTYPAGGDYNATLTVTAADGVTTNSVTNVVSVVAPTPTVEPVAAAFSAAPVEGAPLTIQFANASTGPVATYLWDFGDGTTSNEPNPVHTYGSGGDFPVTLTVTAADGVTTNSVTNAVSVVAPTPTVEPVAAAFSAAPVEGAPLTVQFTSAASGPVASYLWDFGDGTTSSEIHPVHTYPAGGDYNATLTVTAADGVTSDSVTNTVSVVQPTQPPTAEPVDAAFSAAPVADMPLTVQFTNQSTGPVAALTWDFGDGTTSAEPNPVHTYPAAGDFNVTLTVTAADGVTTDSAVQTVSVAAAPVPPTPETPETPGDEPLMTLNALIGEVNDAVWNPSSTRIAAANEDGTISLWDVTTEQVANTLTGHQTDVLALAWSPNGAYLASGSEDGLLLIWDTTTPQPLATAQAAAAIRSLAWNMTSTSLAVGGEDGSVTLYDVAGTPTPVMTANDEVKALAWGVNDTRLLIGVDDGSIILLDMTTLTPLYTLEAENDVNAVAWSPNNQLFATAIADGTVIVWNAATGQPSPLPLDEHGDQVTAVAWSPDGSQIVSGAADGEIILWDAVTGASLDSFEAHTDAVTALEWNSSGTQFLSASDDGTVLVWQP